MKVEKDDDAQGRCRHDLGHTGAGQNAEHRVKQIEACKYQKTASPKAREVRHELEPHNRTPLP